MNKAITAQEIYERLGKIPEEERRTKPILIEVWDSDRMLHLVAQPLTVCNRNTFVELTGNREWDIQNGVSVHDIKKKNNEKIIGESEI